MLKYLNKIKSNPILISSIGLLVITLFVKILGFAEKIVLAYYYGTSYQVDAYTTVITIVLAFFFFFREIVEPGYLSTFLSIKNSGKEKAAWDIFNKVLRLILLVTIGISIVAILFPDKMVTIFAPGFSGDKLNLSIKLIQIAIPACIFLALSTLTGITLNGLKRFALPASGELAFKGLIIVCLVVFYNTYGIIGAAIGIVVGSIGRLAVHLLKLYPKISFRRIAIPDKNKEKLWALTWPLLLGVTFSQVSSLVDNVFASYLQEGAISALSYSKKIIDLPIIIFPSILSIVVFPYFSQLAIEKNEQKLAKLFSDSMQWITIVFIPLTVFFLVFSNPIIEVILKRGAFDASSTLLTARPLAIYSFGLLFYAIEAILVVFYYANEDTKTPVFVGIACVIFNIILTSILINFMDYLGIALAFVAQKTIKNLILLKLLKRKIKFHPKFIRDFLVKILMAGSVFAVTIFLCKIFIFEKFATGFFINVLILVASFTISGLIYIAILYKINVIKSLKKQEPLK